MVRNWELAEPDLDPMTFEPGMVAGLAVRLWRSGWWEAHRGDPQAAFAAAEHLWGRECCPGSYMWRAAAAAVGLLAGVRREEAGMVDGEDRREQPPVPQPQAEVENALELRLMALGGALMAAVALAVAWWAGMLRLGAFWTGALVGACAAFACLAAAQR